MAAEKTEEEQLPPIRSLCHTLMGYFWICRFFFIVDALSCVSVLNHQLNWWAILQVGQMYPCFHLSDGHYHGCRMPPKIFQVGTVARIRQKTQYFPWNRNGEMWINIGILGIHHPSQSGRCLCDLLSQWVHQINILDFAKPSGTTLWWPISASHKSWSIKI